MHYDCLIVDDEKMLAESGLGLYISNYFCNKMGGAMEISSENGFAVTVTLSLS